MFSSTQTQLRTPLIHNAEYATKQERSSVRSFLEGEGLVHVLCFWLGVSVLLPWFSFITSAGYFRDRFCDSAVETSFLSFFSLAYNFSNAATQALLLRHYQRLAPLLQARVYGSLFFILAICLLTTVLVLLPDISAMPLFYTTLVSVMACGALVACFSGGLFAVLGSLPGPVTQTFVAGQGLAGFGVSVVSLTTIALGSQDESFCSVGDDAGAEECAAGVNRSALAFFCTSCAAVLLALGSYRLLEGLPVTKQHREAATKDRANSVSYTGVCEKTGQCSLPADLSSIIIIELSHGEEGDFPDQEQEQEPQELHGLADSSPLPHVTAGPQLQTKYLRVYRQVQVPAWSVFCTFAITLSLFPALTVLITSQHECADDASRLSNDLFIPFFFCLFNSCDFAGRVLARRLRQWVTASNMWLPTLLRIAFVPLVLLCRLEGSVLPVVFTHDSAPMIIVSTFGLSNGALVSLAMMAGPAAVAPRHSPLAATIMLFALTLGLCCGSLLSFVMLFISQGSF